MLSGPMPETPTTGDLFKAKAILDGEVNVAVDAYLATPDMGPYPIAKGYRLDIAAAVEASDFAQKSLADAGLDDDQRRNAVRTAILLARPVKG